MTVQSLIQTCAELGIKLALKEDDNDRLRVAAPQGVLTTPLRDALAAHKPDLIAILKAKQQASHPTQASSVEQDSKEARVKAEPEARGRAQEEAILRAEEEARFRLEAETLRQAAEELAGKRTEAQARLKEQEVKAKEEAVLRAEEEARFCLEAETLRKAAEELARKRTEAHARLKEQEVRAEEEAGSAAEQICVKAEKKARRRPKVEAGMKKEKARLEATRQARANTEAEALRLTEENRVRPTKETRRRAEVEARLKQEEARFRKAQEARSKAEAEASVIAEQARLESDEEDLSKSFDQPFQVEAPSPENSSLKLSWVRSSPDISEDNPDLLHEDDTVHEAPSQEIETFLAEEGIISAEDDSSFPSDVLKRLSSPEAGERKAALAEVLRSGGDDAFCHITPAFDDQSADVRNAAARALFDLQSDRAATFTRALREGTPERRRKIGQALAASGLASEAIGNLTGESREKTYDAFSLLFLMAKAGEAQLLMQAIEDYPNLEVRIAVVKLLALSGQPEIVPAFRRLAVCGSLPSEVRSALMEAIYQISSQARESAPSTA
jgi:hypothetical protein